MSALGGVASPAEMRAVCPAQNPPMGGASYMEQSNLLGSPQEAFLKRSFPWFINVVCVCVCVCVCVWHGGDWTEPSMRMSLF